MNSDLPATGTAALLELLTPFVPDDFIDGCWPHRHTGGRRREYSAAQLYRLHLLGLLTPVRSVNLLVKLLPEQRAWRKFAGLRRQTQVPGVRVLHEFRGRVGVAGLRQINAHLLAPLLAGYLWQPWSVGLIDATDLPAACGGFKKSTRQYSAAHAALGGRTLKTGQSRCFVGYKKHTLRLWRHHYLAGVQLLPLVSWVTPANVSEGGGAGTQPALLPAAMGLVPAAGRGRPGVFGGRRQTAMPGAVARGGADQAAERHETGAALCGLESGGLPAGRTVDVVGLRWSGRRTLVWRRGRTGTLPLLLGSGPLPTAICASTRAARDVAGPLAAGQSVGATNLAARATVD